MSALNHNTLWLWHDTCFFLFFQSSSDVSCHNALWLWHDWFRDLQMYHDCLMIFFFFQTHLIRRLTPKTETRLMSQSMCVAARCSVLQCGAVCGNVWQCDALCAGVLRCVGCSSWLVCKSCYVFISHMSHVVYKLVISHESCHLCMSISHESCHLCMSQMSHAIYTQVISHESCHLCMSISHESYRVCMTWLIMSFMHESYHIWMSHGIDACVVWRMNETCHYERFFSFSFQFPNNIYYTCDMTY